MLYMKKRKPAGTGKSNTPPGFKTAGGAIPIAMEQDYHRKVAAVGLQKQRALAAAIQAFLDADVDQIITWFQKAHENYVKPAMAKDEAAGGGSGQREDELASDARSALKGLRKSEGHSQTDVSPPAGGIRKANHG